MTADDQPQDRVPNPHESAYVLPPLEGHPFADERDKARAVLRVIEQAEHERSASH